MRKAIYVTLFVSIFGYTEIRAQESKLSLFFGEWTGQGNLFGNAASFQLTFSKSLNDKFIQVQFRNEYSVQSKKYSMEALAMYQATTDTTFNGTWFDSRGAKLDLSSMFKNNTLTTEWKGAKEQGKTTYTLANIKELHVKDYVLQNQEWKMFGEATYTRKK